MKKHGKLAPLALGILLGLGFVAGGTQAAFAADAPTASAAQATNVTRATLDNGLRVVVVRDTLAPMVTTQITYLAGSYEAPKGYPGTAHALEHMMFRNSTGLTGAQLNEMTGKMGADNNAFTTNDATQYFFVAPSQYLDMLLHIEAIRMRGAQLTTADWNLEKGAIEQEVSRDIPIRATSRSSRPSARCTPAPATPRTRWVRARRSMRPPARCCRASTTTGTSPTMRSW
jgi:zinc protease